MLEKLESIKQRYKKLSEMTGDPTIIARQDEWREIMKEHAALAPVVEAYDEYMKCLDELHAAEETAKTESDPEMHELLNAEIKDCKERSEQLFHNLKLKLLPVDPNDDKNVVVEIRQGAGGDEAALFAYALQRMYYRYAERNRWKIEDIDSNTNELGGVKEATFMLSGKDAYGKLKYESGVHRVQRVPETESQGRVHTSTVTVAVLPEVSDVKIDINENDLKIDTYRSGGAGGQHVNKTESSIRITHLPTGIVVTCQDERSQVKNREKAMKVLKSRLYDHFQSQADREYADNRKMQIGTGDRSERIRTYNYPQSRVTDHRINVTMYSLDTFLDGDIGEMIEALRIADQNAKLANVKE